MVKKEASKNFKTSKAIIDELKVQGPLGLEQLAKKLEVTKMAVSQHLKQLAEQGMVISKSEKQNIGRPIKLFSLTEKANEIYPDAHAELLVDFIDNVKQAFGEKGLSKIIQQRKKIKLEEYKLALKDAKSLKDKLKILALLRTNEGYMAEVKKDGDEFYLIENHCPICSAAEKCQKLCSAELELFQDSLGSKFNIKRNEHILKGERRCLYVVKEKKLNK